MKTLKVQQTGSGGDPEDVALAGFRLSLTAGACQAFVTNSVHVLVPTVHDQEPPQAPGLCGSTEWRGRHQAAPVLQGDRLGAPGAEEDQATLQTSNCK